MWTPKTERTRATLLLLLLGALMFLPFLGLSDFNSKGEPRHRRTADAAEWQLDIAGNV